MVVKTNMIINFLSVLVSILFPFTALIGMFFGQIASRIFSQYFSSSVGTIGGEFIFYVISGYCAGYFSAFIISKVYKRFNFKYALVIPIFVMLYFGYENIIEASKVSVSFLISSFSRDIIMLITFYIILQGYSLQK